MIRSSDLDHLIEAMIENQPWNEYQKGYYQCISDLRDNTFVREIFGHWWSDRMFLLGVAGGSIIAGAAWLVLTAL